MISDAYIEIECNECGYLDKVELTSTAGRGWDARNLDKWLKRNGWSGDADGNEHLCPDCVEAREERTA